jgi:hypothetical protein
MKALLVAALAVLVIPSAAFAQNYSSEEYWRSKRREHRTWAERALSEDHSDIPGRRYRYAKTRRHIVERRSSRPRAYQTVENRGYGPRVYSYEARSGTQSSGQLCLGEVTGIGQAMIDVRSALESAKLDWNQRVRYAYGERFMNIAVALDIRSRCSRAETNESVIGRQYEKWVEAFTDGKADPFRKRCEIIAAPCSVEWHQGLAPSTPNERTENSELPPYREPVIRELQPPQK